MALKRLLDTPAVAGATTSSTRHTGTCPFLEKPEKEPPTLKAVGTPVRSTLFTP